MSSLLKNTVFYVIGYLLLMTPTYVLPYFGSNSLIANGLGATFGHDPMPQWWLHAWALVMLVLLGHVRGKRVGKRYLMVFPLVAAVFDMVPGLSAIPLVPTVMHLLAIILGAINPVVVSAAVKTDADTQPVPTFLRPAIVAGMMTLATVAGSAWFAFNIAGNGTSANKILASKPHPASVHPKPAPVPAPTAIQSPAEPASPVLPTAQTSATAPDSPLTEKQAAVKPLRSKPMTQATTARTSAKPEPATAPNVRYINLNN